MDFSDWAELFLFLLLLVVLTKPMGIYLYRVLEREGKTHLEWLMGSLEKFTYRFCRIHTEKEQNWKQYLGSIVAFSVICLVVTYLLLVFQGMLPLNPQKLPSLSWHLSFNTAVSFMTNTDWQSYPGEGTMSYFSQMVPLTLQCFVSPAVGMCAAAALIRGIVRSGKRGLGNFWVDLIRLSYYLFFL